MIERINIENFRGLEKISLKNLGSINLFIGDNASGKTSILDATFIGINPNNPSLGLATNTFRGLGTINGLDYNITERMWLSLFNGYNLNTQIKIEFKGDRHREVVLKAVRNEDKGENLLNVIDNQSANPTIQQVTGIELSFKTKENNYKTSRSSIEFNNSGIQSRLDTDYKEHLNGFYLNSRTILKLSNLITKVSSVIERKKENELLDLLKIFETNIQGIKIINDSIHVDDVRFKDSTIDINNYGDGIFRALNIVSSALSLRRGDILLIDEMENGLHWSKQKVLWELLFRLVERELQLFITTHSLELIRYLIEVLEDNINYSNLVKIYRIEKVRDKNNIVEMKASEIESLLNQNLEIR